MLSLHFFFARDFFFIMGIVIFVFTIWWLNFSILFFVNFFLSLVSFFFFFHFTTPNFPAICTSLLQFSAISGMVYCFGACRLSQYFTPCVQICFECRLVFVVVVVVVITVEMMLRIWLFDDFFFLSFETYWVGALQLSQLSSGWQVVYV